MGDDHGPSGVIDPQPPSGKQELVINLRRSEASFLIHLSRATNLDSGEVCERLIALAAHTKKPEEGQSTGDVRDLTLSSNSDDAAKQDAKTLIEIGFVPCIWDNTMPDRPLKLGVLRWSPTCTTL